VYHPPRGPAKGYQGYHEMARAFIGAFPDLHFDIEEAIERDGLVGARIVIRGTHRGVWRGLAPTGRRFEAQGRPWLRFRDGLVVEVWSLWDEMGAWETLTSPS
jgi:predicted ester cyclase